MSRERKAPSALRKSTLLLASLALLTGCAETQKPVPIATDKLCQSGWKHQTIKKTDKLSDETAAGIEGGNKARPDWGCEYGENRAKS